MGMKGRDKHMRRLKRLGGAGLNLAVGKVLEVGAGMIRAGAFQSISAGSVSGAKHVPSSPGQPPNRDTGHLQGLLETQRTGPVTAEVRSNADYASPLEFGTSKMAARPYMRPARDKSEPKIQRLFATEMSKLVKRSGT